MPAHNHPAVFIRVVAITACIALTMGACAYQHDKGAESAARGQNPPSARGSAAAPGFAEVSAAVIGPRCASCHHHESYKQYATVFGARADILDQVFVQKRMPKGCTPLTDAESALLRRWLDAGAPEQATAGTESPAPGATATPVPAPTPVLSADNSPIPARVTEAFFKPHCIRCHDTTRAAGGLDLTHPARVRGAIDSILHRYLVMQNMPPRRPAFESITEEQREILLDWIAAKMPGETPAAQPEPTITPATPDFARVSAEVLEPSCVMCHGKFSRYEAVFSSRDAIRDAVFIRRTMPKGDRLTADQSELLMRWLDAGAPN